MAASALVEGLRRLNRATRRHRRIRRAGVAVYATTVRANVFLPPPRVLLNGPAKSGTHLLADCLGLLPRMMFSGRHFVPADFVTAGALDVARLGSYLRRCPKGMFVTTHAGYRPELEELVARLDYRHVLLLRDPRDMVVSFAHFVAAGEWLARHDHFAGLADVDDRVMAAITGYDRPDGRLPSVGEVLDTFLPWLDRPDVLICRFEDLVGPEGGGDVERQRVAIQRIADFVHRPLDADAATRVAQGMYGRSGLTFRSGRCGEWRDVFSDAHRQAFKEVAGPQLVTLGYEAGSDW